MFLKSLSTVLTAKIGALGSKLADKTSNEHDESTNSSL